MVNSRGLRTNCLPTALTVNKTAQQEPYGSFAITDSTCLMMSLHPLQKRAASHAYSTEEKKCTHQPKMYANFPVCFSSCGGFVSRSCFLNRKQQQQQSASTIFADPPASNMAHFSHSWTEPESQTDCLSNSNFLPCRRNSVVPSGPSNNEARGPAE